LNDTSALQRKQQGVEIDFCPRVSFVLLHTHSENIMLVKTYAIFFLYWRKVRSGTK
jgi:Zn-finger nucleic acid-binding protein